MKEKDSYEQAMRRALARKPFLKTDGKYPSREEIHRRGTAMVSRDTPRSGLDRPNKDVAVTKVTTEKA